MPRKARIALWSVIPIAVLLLPVVAYAINRAVTSGEIARGVIAGGFDLGGLGREDALAVLEDYEQRLATTPVVFRIKGQDFSVPPERFGLDIDEEALVDAAFEQRRTGFVAGFFEWLRSLSEEILIPIQVGYDGDAFAALLEQWESQAIDNPAYEGDIIIRDGKALPDYPREGEGIRREEAQRLVARAIQSLDREPVVIPIRTLQPELTAEDIDAAVERANRLIGSPVTLRSEDPAVEITLTPEQLTGAFYAEVERNSPVSIDLGFDRAAVAALIAPFRDQLEQPPRDAAFVVDEEAETVSLLPGRSETLVDIDLIVEALTEAALSEEGIGELPLVEGREPDFTTAEAEAMLPMGLVSEFTTRHKCCEPRVNNIHTIADFVDGAVVKPGETFSLNEYVGERTTAKGYVPAPTIIAGELEDTIGGGVSQFATTFYNAVFYGCYEDIAHKPHSFYISRYPEVNEATISWRQPDLVFRNDSDALIIIKTQYTDTSITVQFYGNNGGRTCERQLGERHAFVAPKDTFEPNPELVPGDQHVVQNGITGFTNTVKRIMTHRDGTVTEEEWSWRYRPVDRVIEVHPCEVPGAEVECPIPVPGVVGQTQAAATSALQSAGFVVKVGDPVPLDDAAQAGIVQSQTPAAGQYLDVGATVTIRVGQFTGEE